MNQLEDAHRTPIIKLWDLLLVPLQGEVTDRQARLLTDEVLTRIHRTGARGLVVDLSAMWMVDSHLCSVLARLATSARLMGTRTVLSGMSAEVALTLQAMGVDLRGLESALGLEEAVEMLNGGALAPKSTAQEAEALIDSLLAETPSAERKSR